MVTPLSAERDGEIRNAVHAAAIVCMHNSQAHISSQEQGSLPRFMGPAHRARRDMIETQRKAEAPIRKVSVSHEVVLKAEATQWHLSATFSRQRDTQ